MPSRKSEPSETKAEPRRSSLRRLGSIASLQTLNPFNRRRSNNTVTDSPASTSNTSLSSTAANPPLPNKSFTSSSPIQEDEPEDEAKPLPAPPQEPARKASYICLPDDPIGGMPRSRTFSNLPVPTRMKKPGIGLGQSKSHTRLPSALLPTRIPSPRPSTRKHSVTRLTTIDSNTPSKDSVARSDLEPLFNFSFDQPSNQRRSTAFKENFSIGPTRQVAYPERKDTKDFYPPSAIPSRAYYERHTAANSGHASQASLSYGYGFHHTPSASTSTMSLTKYAELPEGAYKRFSHKYDSSPIYRSSRDRAPTPSQPVQRWNSQPVLTSQQAMNNPNPPLQRSNRSSFGEIKQTRLMSAMPPPTPPPPKTPLGAEMLGQSQLKSSNSSSHIVRESAKGLKLDIKPVHPVTRAKAEAHKEVNKLNPNGSIKRAEPSAYWTGRFSSLNDKYRNDDLMRALNLDAAKSPTTFSSKADTDKLYTPAATEARMRRAVKYLHSECATDEARQSFYKWQQSLKDALNAPELRKPVGGKSCALQMSLSEVLRTSETNGYGTPPLSAGRKISFMDRLLGKKPKALGASG